MVKIGDCGSKCKCKSLEEEMAEVDVAISELSGYPPSYHAFQRVYNPMALYTRLVHEGLDPDHALKLCKNYEFASYMPIITFLKYHYDEQKKDKT